MTKMKEDLHWAVVESHHSHSSFQLHASLSAVTCYQLCCQGSWGMQLPEQGKSFFCFVKQVFRFGQIKVIPLKDILKRFRKFPEDDRCANILLFGQHIYSVRCLLLAKGRTYWYWNDIEMILILKDSSFQDVDVSSKNVQEVLSANHSTV